MAGTTGPLRKQKWRTSIYNEIVPGLAPSRKGGVVRAKDGDWQNEILTESENKEENLNLKSLKMEIL